jgi:putative endonuclease
MRTYYVYIMASRSRVLYTGVTNNIVRRVNEHKQHVNPGFTSRYRVTRLVYFEEFRYILSAIAREKQIKGWRRSRKVELIEGRNPRWRDLARDPAFPTFSFHPARPDACHPERRRREGSFAPFGRSG